jgi:sugar phosphate isomerase/epimerase
MSVSRRQFLPLAGSVCAAAALPRKIWAAGSLPVGIQLYTVNADFMKDPAGTLKKLAQIGYTEVETAGWGKLSPAQLRDQLRNAGLRAPSAHLNFGMQDTPKLLDEAKTVGATYAVSSVLTANPPGKGMQDVLKGLNAMTADDFRRTAAKANEIGKQAKAAGLQYAYHNHNFEFRDLGDGQTGYDILLKETDPALVKFEADCGWMKVAGKDPVEYLSKHGDRYAMLHIKDFKNISKPVTALMSPDAPPPTELGRGSVDLKPIIEAGRKAGVRHMFVEQEPPFKEMPAMEAAAVDYQVLSSLLAQA